MGLHATLFGLLLTLTLVSGNLLHDERRTRRPSRGEPEKGLKASTKTQDRQDRSVMGNLECQEGNPLCEPKMLKVFDFSADNDQEPDSNGEYTSATLDAGPLPESFTICSAFMVEAWTTGFTATRMFTLLDVDGERWGRIYLFAASSYTEYEVEVGPKKFRKQTEAVLFPLQWTQACLSLDSRANKVRVVVDGQLLEEEEYRREEDTGRPADLNLMLGSSRNAQGWTREMTGKISNLNVFNSSLSVERMVGLTRAGEEECGAPGDLVSWEEAEWTLHSQAKCQSTFLCQTAVLQGSQAI